MTLPYDLYNLVIIIYEINLENYYSDNAETKNNRTMH